MKKRILGVDIGITSLGWAVVDIDEEEVTNNNNESKYKINSGTIVGSGVRIWKEPVDRQGKSLAATRGADIRKRRTIERKAERLRRLIKLAKQYYIISDDFNLNSLNVPAKVSLTDWNIWKLRSRAIKEKLSPFEIFRILYHIANHRGFYFPTKAEEKNIEANSAKDNLETNDGNNDTKAKEDKKAKAGIKEIKEKFKDSKCLTIGEFIYQKEGKKHNSKNDYSVSLYRTDLKAEIEYILKFQRAQGNIMFSEEFEKKYINEILMYTHPLDDEKIKAMIGECELIKDQLRFPKHGYEAELFTFYNRINNLKIKNRENDSLTDEEREKILQSVKRAKDCKLSFSDLRNILKLENYEQKFNLCSYREYNPEYEKFIKFSQNKIEQFKTEYLDCYDKETGELQNENIWLILKSQIDEIFEKYPNKKDIKYYYSDIRKQLKLPDNIRFEKLKKDYCLSIGEIGKEKYYAQFEKETFVEFSGYNMLKKGLKECFIDESSILNTIAEALVYYQSDKTRKQYLQEHGIDNEILINKILELNMKDVSPFSLKALQKLNREMQKGTLFNKAKEELGYVEEYAEKTSEIEPYHGNFEKNATVARIIGEFRKTVNAINKTYGVIDEIHIEMATDVANSKAKIAHIRNGQIRYKEQRDTARERCIEYNLNPDAGDNLLRFRLAEEQDFKCIYTGVQIYLGSLDSTPANAVNIAECDIDHIIPISRSFNDSLANKVICSNLANREKTNRLPYEWFHDPKNSKTEEDWEKFRIRVLSGNRMNGTKKRNLLLESFTEKDMENFISRDLNNTRYATRHIADYLRKYFSFEKSEHNMLNVNRIRVFGGKITAKLRHMWGLDKNRDENNLHHAQDAIVIACTSFGNIYYICSVLKKLEQLGEHPKKQQIVPWTNFRDDVKQSLDNIIVSQMLRCSATGQAHKQPVKTDTGTQIIRKGAQNAINVSLDSMFRYDIYHNDKGYYCVPIYAIDLSKKNDKFKHIIQPSPKKGEECEAVAEEFVFSLYKGAYIKIVTEDDEVLEGYISQYNAASGQFYIESVNGDRVYEINTSTLEIGNYIKLKLENNSTRTVLVNSYNIDNKKLALISAEGDKFFVEAEEKLDKKGKGSGKYATTRPYTKVDKEKKISLSVIKDLQKYTIDRLGNLTRVKKETERFSNKLKSNAQRVKEKRAKKAQKREN